MTDASGKAMGAVLMQRDDEGNLHPVAFYSMKHTDAESNYAVHEFELLAIFKALKHWKYLLIGSEKTLIYTDHKPLTHLLDQPELSPRQQRWITFLADFDVDIIAVEGSKNKVADCLSRYNYDSLTQAADSLRQTFVQNIKRDPASMSTLYAKTGYSECSGLQPSSVEWAIEGSSIDPKARKQQLTDMCSEIAEFFGGGGATKPGFSLMTVSQMRNAIISAYDGDALATLALKGECKYADMAVKNGLIYHYDRDGNETLYIPESAEVRSSQPITEFPAPGEIPRTRCSLREELLRQVHGNGHIGIGKTIEAMNRRYYWPKLRRSVQDYIRGCVPCQHNKRRTHKLYGQLRAVEVPARRWQHVNMDFIVALPMTKSGYDSIFVVIDRYSKLAHFIPTITGVNAPQTAHLYYNHVFKHHGLPTKIVSDRGPIFTSDMWTSLMKLMGIQIAMSTPYHPETDGLVERTNLTLKEMLRSFSDNARLDWDQYLTAAEFVYNNTINSSTGTTPFELMTNQKPYEAHDLAVKKLRGDLDEIENDLDIDYDRGASEFVQTFHDKLELARQNLMEAIERMRRYHDGKTLTLEKGMFQVGSKVWLDAKFLRVVDTKGNMGARKALDQRRMGPYEIVEVLGDGTAFRLKLPPHQRFHPVQPISRLSIHRSSTEFPLAHAEVPVQPVSADGNLEFEVEKIIRYRKLRRRPQYLVKFLGYSEDYNMWLPESNLANSLELLDAFKLEHKLIPSRKNARFDYGSGSPMDLEWYMQGS